MNFQPEAEKCFSLPLRLDVSREILNVRKSLFELKNASFSRFGSCPAFIDHQFLIWPKSFRLIQSGQLIFFGWLETWYCMVNTYRNPYLMHVYLVKLYTRYMARTSEVFKKTVYIAHPCRFETDRESAIMSDIFKAVAFESGIQLQLPPIEAHSTIINVWSYHAHP